ncbi:ATP-binding protein [Streptomyces pratensis]|uniref:ATP-binding protein n=1 Tax=Streptomyces pratensis TaxID=1169025 RepID=UPI0019326406|nr:ATP-binding protein [Streptomyces pratensis]
MPDYDAGAPLRSVLPFEAEPTRVRDLRKAVRGQLAEWGLAAVIDEAELAASELASNVIKHVGRGTAATLVLEVTGERLRIELHDMSHCPPALGCVARDEEEGGRGLRLLAAFSVDWGTLQTATGKMVWCELSRTGGADCVQVRRADRVLSMYRELAEADPVPFLSHPRAHEERATALIVDLLHWLGAQGCDPDNLLDRAQQRYEAGLEPVA